MKKVLCNLMLSAVLLLSAGCIPTTADIQVLNDDVNTLMERIDEQQEKFTKGVDKIQEQVVAVTSAMETAEGTIESLIAGNAASAPFNPYAGLIDAVLKGALVLTTAGAGTSAVVAAKRSRETSAIRSQVNTMAAQADSHLGAELNKIVNGHG